MKTIEVVAAIIRDGERFFATQRGYGEFKGYWEFPGGKVEPGESSEQALVREISEELSVRISVGSFLCTVDCDYPRFHLKMHCYICSVEEGAPVLSEHLSSKWLTKAALPSVEWLPADAEVVKNLLSAAEI